MSALVSVVTPSFNYARFLPACLDSVRAQTYPAIEHLVLDACSTDGTGAVLAAYRGTYRLEVAVEQDRGQADALNRGFQRARGDVLCWLNADDFWLHPAVVGEAVAALEAGADVVTATGRFVDADGRLGRRYLVDPHHILPELRYYDSVLQPATFWRRSVHRPLRSDLHYAFDWRLWLEMRAAGARFQVCDREWAAYRMHAVNKTSADPADRRREVADVLAETCGKKSPQYLWARGVYEASRAAEALGWPGGKRAVQLANIAMWKLSRRRVFSC